MSKAAQTRQYIIERTAVIFNRNGFAGTSLTDLTEATRLTKGALYGNFTNKDEMALAAFDYNTRMIRALFIEAGPAEESCTQRLLAVPEFYQKHFDTLSKAGGCPILNTATEADDNQPALRRKVNHTISRWKKSLVAIIAQGVSDAEFKKDVDAAAFAASFLSLLEGALMLSKSTGDRLYIDSAVNRMKEMVQNELRT